MMEDYPDESRTMVSNSTLADIMGTVMIIALIVLFAVAVFLVFLHLYVRWYWQNDQETNLPIHHTRRRRRRFVFAHIQDSSELAMQRGLQPSVLRSLPVLVFNPEEFKDGLECAVCLSEVVQGEKVRLLPKCRHGFHVDCIDMWFHTHSTCPLCRNSVSLESSSVSVYQSSEENIPSSPSEESRIPAEEGSSFPANVLFWGNETRVNSRNCSMEEGISSHSMLPLPSQPTSPSSSRPNGMLVIDIPRQMSGSSLLSPKEEAKSPMIARLRSLKRLLSREKRSNPCSPGSVEVEQQGTVQCQ